MSRQPCKKRSERDADPMLMKMMGRNCATAKVTLNYIILHTSQKYKLIISLRMNRSQKLAIFCLVYLQFMLNVYVTTHVADSLCVLSPEQQ